MKNLLVTFLFFVTFVVGVVAQPIKVGVMTSLSGDLASAGEDVRNGILLALEDVGKDRYQLIMEDARCSGLQSVKAANKLVSIDKVSYVLGPVCNQELLPSAPIFDRAGVLMISAWATSGDVHDLGKKNFR